MNNGISFLCNLQGKIIEVIRNDLQINAQNLVGQLFISILDKAILDKAFNFLTEIQTKGAAFDWVLTINVNDRLIPLHFIGSKHNNQFFILGAKTISDMNYFYDEMMKLNNEQANSFRQIMKDYQQLSTNAIDRDNQFYDELTKLNNELTSTQRELARKNNLLERQKQELNLLNQELSETINKLEITQNMLESEKIALQEANHKAETLLLNILPKPIAKRLQQGEEIITDTFSNVTVLFADITGFTQLSTQVSPKKLVYQLNLIFSELDLYVEKYSIEKIKTIGDCYMAVAGIPIPYKNHAHLMAELSLDIHEMANHFSIGKHELKFRIGINSGTVIAGVIGKRKFIYDLWGDTVNTASRMESHGVVGETQVTEATYELLKNDYIFEKRPAMEVKGKGKMQVYLLKGRVSPRYNHIPIFLY